MAGVVFKVILVVAVIIAVQLVLVLYSSSAVQLRCVRHGGRSPHSSFNNPDRHSVLVAGRSSKAYPRVKRTMHQHRHRDAVKPDGIMRTNFVCRAIAAVR